MGSSDSAVTSSTQYTGATFRHRHLLSREQQPFHHGATTSPNFFFFVVVVVVVVVVVLVRLPPYDRVEQRPVPL